MNCQWSDEEFASHLPAVAKRYIAKNNINVYLIDAIDLAEKVGMGKRTNTVLQSAFFSLAQVLPAEDAIEYMKAAAEKSYAKKGQSIVEANWKAIDAGATAYRKLEVPADWANAEDEKVELTLEGREAIVKQVTRAHGAHQPHGRRLAARLQVRRRCRRPVASSAPLSTRSAASPLWFRTGTRPSASSATSAPSSARTPRSARS